MEIDVMKRPATLVYQSGFGNHFSTEAELGALPIGRNSPQHPPYGLYPEALSGTAFTTPRTDNRRSWLYRLRPSVTQQSFQRVDNQRLCSTPFSKEDITPAQLRWPPLAAPSEPTDFIEGLVTMGGNGAVEHQFGIGIHLYAANRSMTDKVFSNADGELLIVPYLGALQLDTELGVLVMAPGELALIPRGVRFRVRLLDDVASGYICENYGEAFRLPELGPIGSNGLANARDFLAPMAYYEDNNIEHTIITKFMGGLWASKIDHSPLDVVAWHGNLTPFKYDLNRFNTIGSVSFDHPDPSIFSVLTSPSNTAGVANCDFVVFPPRWNVAEDTFRPPWFHRNIMSEFMGLIRGRHDAKADNFVPGGSSLHNCMSPHGPDAKTVDEATKVDLKPNKITDSMAFMFESRYIIQPTAEAMNANFLQQDYWTCWQGIGKRFNGSP